MSRRLLGLCGCGSVLLALTGAGLYAQREHGIDGFVVIALAQGAVYALATWLVWRGVRSRHAAAIIIFLAAAMRAVVVLAPPYLSSDIYRYVWDGRVIAAGINPYRYVPNDPHLAALRDPDIFPEINRGNYARTIYPPAAQAIFFLVTRLGESLTVMKLAMIGFEAVAVVLMLRLLTAAGRPAAWIAVYAWHPLPLWEFAGSGHIDAAMIAFVALALWSRRPWLTGLALAGGTLVKLYPAALLPALWHRWDWRMPALFCIALVAAYPGRLPGPARTSSVSCPAMRPRKALPRAPAFTGGIWRHQSCRSAASRTWLTSPPRDVCSPRSPLGSPSGGPVRASIFMVPRCSPPPLPRC